MVSIKFQGGRELEAALSEFSVPTAKGVVRRTLSAVAKPILESWKSKTTKLTGHLIDSEVSGGRLNPRQRKLAKRLGKAEVEVYVGTADPAGLQEEFGNVHQRAHPALRPAWEAEGGQTALDRLGAGLWVEIEKAAKRAARRALKARR